MKSFKNKILLLLSSMIFFSCAAHAHPGVVVQVRPPAPRVVVVKPAKPHHHAIWVPGHWEWRKNKYVWKNGYWVKPRKGYVYVPGHWAERDRGWVWIPGHWKRV